MREVRLEEAERVVAPDLLEGAQDVGVVSSQTIGSLSVSTGTRMSEEAVLAELDSLVVRWWSKLSTWESDTRDRDRIRCHDEMCSRGSVL